MLMKCSDNQAVYCTGIYYIFLNCMIIYYLLRKEIEFSTKYLYFIFLIWKRQSFKFLLSAFIIIFKFIMYSEMYDL